MTLSILSFLGFIPLLLPVIVLIIAVVFIMKFMNRYEQRAQERLELERQSAAFQQKQLEVLSLKLERIEKMLEAKN